MTYTERKADYLKRLLTMQASDGSNAGGFPVTDEEVVWFEEATKDMVIPEMPDILKSAWSMIVSGYLKSEVRNGNREFRISFQDDKRFIIHPLGKDGKTLDWSL